MAFAVGMVTNHMIFYSSIVFSCFGNHDYYKSFNKINVFFFGGGRGV